MNSHATYGLQMPQAIAAKSRKLCGHAIRLAAILLIATAAFAQYDTTGMGGTVGTTGAGTYGAPGTPGYGRGKAIGIGVGAAAAGVGAIYFITHRSAKVSGCVEPADDGLHLTDDKTRRSLELVPGRADLKPGERVELKGKIKKSPAGDQRFLVKTVKSLGECRTQAHAAPGDLEGR